MNRDLEDQLKEMGAEYGALVGRLLAAKTVEPKAGGLGRRSRSTAEWLIAASLLIALCFSVHLVTSSPRHLVTSPLTSSPRHFATPSLTSSPRHFATPSPSFGAREYHFSPAEMIASQQPDGGWQNDFLTRRNAEVLARCDTPEARIAYKKAMRNLRARGVL